MRVFAGKNLSEDSRVIKLRERMNAWDIHGGDEYMCSSFMGLNRPGYGLPDTRHDLRVFAQFMDWMDSRSAQARALLSDMADYAVWEKTVCRFFVWRDCRDFRKNFAVRAIMVLYGVDVTRHPDLLIRNDWDIEVTPGDIADVYDSVLCGRFDAILDRLNQFVSDWSKISDAECVGIRNVRNAVVIFPGGPVNKIYSVRMLHRYLLEVCGHEAYWSSVQSRDMHKNIPAPRPDVNARNLDDRFVRRILDLCDLDKHLLLSGPLSALDGSGLQKLVESRC